jgi:hypothetical protein
MNSGAGKMVSGLGEGFSTCLRMIVSYLGVAFTDFVWPCVVVPIMSNAQKKTEMIMLFIV